MKPLTVICWRWQPRPGYRSTYPPETVLTLKAMVARNYPHPHRFVCITDDPKPLEGKVEVIPDFGDFASIPSPHGGKNPSCYRRLRMFHPDAAQWFGKRFVSLDLDVVITGDLTPLWHRSEDIVLWGHTNRQPGSHYNGSMILLRAGSRPKVWTDFQPSESPQKSLRARCWGSDQGWLSFCLGGGEAKWSQRDGVYSFRNDLKQERALPANAKLVVFHGATDPWSVPAQQLRWVQEHYRRDEVAVAC